MQDVKDVNTPSTASPSPTPSRTPKPTTTKTPKPSPTPSPKPTRPPGDPECPWPDPLNYTVHLPHETDCTKFYKCDNGKKVEFDCPDGLHFNKELEVCDWPQDAGCEDVNTPSTASPSPTPSRTPKPTTTKTPKPSPTPSPKPTRPPGDPECPWPDPLNYTVHLPHETDCTKFYKCDNGKKVEFDCPDGLHFNKELEVCDWPQDAGCEEVNTPSTASPSPTPSRTPKPTTTKTPKPSPTPSPKPTRPPGDPECPWPDPLNYTVHLPHETDCTKFYKCDNGKKVEFDCPDGLHFNKELEVCDWPQDAGCEEVNTPSTASPSPTPSRTPKPTTTKTPKPSPTPSPKPTRPPGDPECPWPDPLNYTVHLPHETDCTKFYKCDNGKKVEFDCPDGLHFNKELEVCDWPQDAGCEEVNTPSTASPSPTPSRTPKPTTTKTPKPSPTPSPKPTRPPGDPECPWPDPLNYTVHLPHETDCTKFYKCDNGKKVEFDCPDGLHFNKELEVCDWPQDAGCEEVNTPSTASPSPTPSRTPKPTTTKTPKPSPTPSPKPTRPPGDPECPWPDPLNYTVHLPHETDCTKFYKCDNGKKVEFDCPDGLHFNKELEVCDWPQDAGCEDVNTPSTASPSPTPSRTPKPTTTKTPKPSPTPSPQPEPTRPPGWHPECPWPDPLNYTVHLPHETDCTKFYKCDNGQKVEFDCPDGLHFNEELEVCDWPEYAGCEDIEPPPCPTGPPSSTPPEPKPTPPIDPECPWPDPLNYTVHLPHETDCTKFYKCDNGQKVEFDCPDGLHFNKELEVCDWPQDAGCEDVNPPSTASPSPTPSITPQPIPTKTPNPSPTPSPEPEPTRPPGWDPECPWPDPLNYTVHLPHETDCTKFYKCDNGGKVEFDCPDGLHFNKELQVCDWPQDAGCEDVSTEPAPTTTPADRCPHVECQDSTIYLPDLSNPRRYIRCVRGVEVVETCPGTLVFDRRLATCNLQHLEGPVL
jgi:hypothetical protein